ncbi:MAG: glycogen-binding domain-containing protein, partial [Nitrospirae bacterium]|nr:glycogen-binding domain-containing protein [Nitrospirota bacterium]
LIVRLAVLIAFLYLPACSTLQHLGPTVTENGVVFRLKYPEAKRVNIVGSFNQWDKDKDALSGPDADGVWSITLPMKDGRYEYLFLTDGEKWMLDPSVPSADDVFGGRNSVIHIKK